MTLASDSRNAGLFKKIKLHYESLFIAAINLQVRYPCKFIKKIELHSASLFFNKVALRKFIIQ